MRKTIRIRCLKDAQYDFGFWSGMGSVLDLYGVGSKLPKLPCEQKCWQYDAEQMRKDYERAIEEAVAGYTQLSCRVGNSMEWPTITNRMTMPETNLR